MVTLVTAMFVAAKDLGGLDILINNAGLPGGVGEERCYQVNLVSDDVIMGAMASQITGVSVVCLTVCSGTYQRKHQSSTSLVTGEFPTQMASNAENVSIWWRHHVMIFYSTSPLLNKLICQYSFWDSNLEWTQSDIRSNMQRTLLKTTTTTSLRYEEKLPNSRTSFAVRTEEGYGNGRLVHAHWRGRTWRGHCQCGLHTRLVSTGGLLKYHALCRCIGYTWGFWYDIYRTWICNCIPPNSMGWNYLSIL